MAQVFARNHAHYTTGVGVSKLKATRQFLQSVPVNVLLSLKEYKHSLQSCLPHFDLAIHFQIHICDTRQLRPFQTFQGQGLMKGGGLLLYRCR